MSELKLPRWKCHKEVEAFKIAEIRPSSHLLDRSDIVIDCEDESPEKFDDTYYLFSEGKDYKAHVTKKYVLDYKPVVGGYYVRYGDGYESFSPAEAFEDGYTLIDDDLPDLQELSLCLYRNRELVAIMPLRDLFNEIIGDLRVDMTGGSVYGKLIHKEDVPAEK